MRSEFDKNIINELESMFLVKKFNKSLFCLQLLSIFIFPNLAIGQQSGLKDLNEIEVLVEDLHSDAIDGGLSREYLERIVELRLRQNGLKVLNKADSFLYLNCNISKTETSNGRFDGYIYSINLRLNQPVYLYTNLDEIQIASTWHTSLLGYNFNFFIKDDIGNAVKERV